MTRSSSARGVASIADDVAAWPVQAVPAISAKLWVCGPDAIAHERNLVRAPIWGTDLVVAPAALYGAPMQQVLGRPLTFGDQRLFGEITTEYVRDGCPADGHVDFSVSALARALHSHGVIGGKQRKAVLAAVRRLRAIGYESILRAVDGTETRVGWGLLSDRYVVPTRGRNRVYLGEVIADLLRDGSVVLLSREMWTHISREDVLAARLWSFLAGERLPGPTQRPWAYTLADVQRVLGLTWRRQDRVAARVAAACRVVEHHDSAYHLTLVRSETAGGGYRLEVTRQGSRQRSEGGPSRVPQLVLSAWHHAVGPRQPSARQLVVLGEWAGTYGADWVAGHMVGSDPYGSVREAVAARELTIAAAEVEHQQAKADSERGLELVWATLRERGLVANPAAGALQ